MLNLEKMEVLDLILSTRLIPSARVSSAQAALRVFDALREGGVRLIEVAMTVPGALEVIRVAGERYGRQIAVGAGAVLDLGSANAALLAGAQFLASPVLDAEIIRLGRRHGVLIIPGAATPSEIFAAWNSGASLVKIFPAASLGGPDFIRSIKEPFPHISVIPAGGVNLDNAGAFIEAGAAALGVEGELLEKASIARGDFAAVASNAAAFLSAVRNPSKEVRS